MNLSCRDSIDRAACDRIGHGRSLRVSADRFAPQRQRSPTARRTSHLPVMAACNEAHN